MAKRKQTEHDEQIYRAIDRAKRVIAKNPNISEIQVKFILKLWDSISEDAVPTEVFPEQVAYTLDLIKSHPEWKNNKEINPSLYDKYRMNINFAKREYEHVFDRAKLIVRIDDLLAKGILDQRKHRMVCNNTAALSNCSGKLHKLDDVDLKDILQKIFTRYPKFDMSRETLDTFLEPEFEKRNMCGRHQEHDKLAREVAIPFLKSKGCLFPATEVVVIPGKSGFKADALGYKGNEVWGIEVKRTVADFKKGIEKDQYKAYMQFCNVFYILTNNSKVKKLAIEWSKEKTDGAVGVLYAEDFGLPDEIPGIKREISGQDRMQATESLSSKYLGNVVRCVIRENVNEKPETMIEAIKEQLTSSIKEI